MTIDVQAAAAHTRWPDPSSYRSMRDNAADSTSDRVEQNRSVGAQTLGTPHSTTPSALVQQDFEVAVRLSPNAQSPPPATDPAKVERTPWHGADKAASNPYGDVVDSLRRAALRRDAAAAASAAAPKPDTVPEETAATSPRDAPEAVASR